MGGACVGAMQTASAIELWAGVECSVVRLGERTVDQIALTGHDRRSDDLVRLAALGIRAMRYPVLWERRPHGWSFADAGLEALRQLGIAPIVGLVHHGSGPRSTSLVDDSFVSGLTDYARAVARRFPWVDAYTPVNEPLTTARFSCLYGHWYPHLRDDRAFVRALLVQCRAVRAAMTAIREIRPSAKLVQTEDIGTVSSTPALDYQARFENERRFSSLDLLAGRIDAHHPMRPWLVGCGAPEHELDDFVARPCPPDIIGINYYVTSDRFLDEHHARYPAHLRGGNGRDVYADVEAARVEDAGITGHRGVLGILWQRYRTRLAVTEVHLGCSEDEQIRWLHEAWTGAEAARRDGADVRAVTAWSAFGAYDWDSLLTLRRERYESGLFDIGDGTVRPTALAAVARELALSGRSAHPALAVPGWWRRPERVLYPSKRRVVANEAEARDA
jgi:dTDP-4-dehydrorhamnose reductase